MGSFCATRGSQREQEVAGLALHGGDGGTAAARGAEQAGRLEVEDRTYLQFPKILGTQL